MADQSGVAGFVAHFGALMNQSGMPGLSGHVFALLLADPDATMTSQEIGEALGISAGAVSTATRYLAQVGLTRRLRVPGTRRVAHALVDEDWYEAMLARHNVLVTTRELLYEGSQAAGGVATAAGQRLWLNAEMFSSLGTALTQALDDWHARRERLLGELESSGGQTGDSAAGDD